MNDAIKRSLVDSWQEMAVMMGDNGGNSTEAHGAHRVLAHLMESPWASAREMAGSLEMSRGEMILAFKCLQRADGLRSLYADSIHSDYFNVVRHYFNTRFYTLVFFVGTNCPSRCVFCPNVRVHDDGTRSLFGYGEGMNPLSRDSIEDVFQGLEMLKETGTNLLVKISGGLEPMTDVKTLETIAGRAIDLGAPVKLFTNGILLNTEARRRAALMAGDIRISLSTADAMQYEHINFGTHTPRARMRLDHVKENIRQLVAERDVKHSNAKVGFNSIIMPTNCDQVIPLVELARDLGVDYIDFKPDYFGVVTPEDQARIDAIVEEATAFSKTSTDGSLYLHFAGSINRKHLYWRHWDGVCDAVSQAHYKMFVTPFGHLSPIHYGAFPHTTQNPDAELRRWAVGHLGRRERFLDVIASPAEMPEVPWSCLNPFELMLSLEIEREQKDLAWGIPLACSPYHTSLKDELPREFMDAWKRRDYAV